MEMEYNATYSGQRCAHTWSIMDGEAMITVIKPNSSELSHNGQYLVVYEDAYGETKTQTQTLEQIAMFYMIDMRELEDNLI